MHNIYYKINMINANNDNSKYFLVIDRLTGRTEKHLVIMYNKSESQN